MKERSSVASYLEDFQNHGEACAYVKRRGYRTERWSYHRIAETAIRFARELDSRGINKGDRVMLWGENCAEWVAVFLGCASSGVVVVPMDDSASADFAHRVFRRKVGRRTVVHGHDDSASADFAHRVFRQVA